MALSPEDFYAHALASTDDEQRWPLSRMTMWDVAPFDQGGLRVAPLRPPLQRIGGVGVPLVLMLAEALSGSYQAGAR